MKNANNMEFNPEGISSLNELLEARELTGQMPETMPTGIRVKNRENSSDCTIDCDCACSDCSGDYQCLD